MADCNHECGSCGKSCSERDLKAYLHKDSKVKKVIGIVSGKGGVGKSLVTSLLASKVNKDGFKTAILDAENNLLFSDYERHYANIRETLCEGSVKIDKAKPGMYSGTGLGSVNCAMTSEPILGDYISIYYKHPAGEWLRIGSDFFEASSQCTDRYGVVDVPVICVPATIRAGKVLYPYVIPGARTIKEVSWSCDGSSVDRKLFTPSSGSHTLRAVIKYKDGGTDTLIRKIKVD